MTDPPNLSSEGRSDNAIEKKNIYDYTYEIQGQKFFSIFYLIRMLRNSICISIQFGSHKSISDL